MITLKSKTEFYEKYESEDTIIMIALLDEKPATITIKPKRYLYPEIEYFGKGDIRLTYNMVTVSDERREQFEKHYKAACVFVDTELKPFIQERFSEKENENGIEN